VIYAVASVWLADLSRSASTVPIAVAGVRTPVRSGRRSRSSARHSALSPSITDVAPTQAYALLLTITRIDRCAGSMQRCMRAG
jgi:hypothetical protein